MKLDGKVALVTASGRGIGRTTALTLAREGADVIVNSFSEESTARTSGEVEAIGRRALPLVGDILKADVVSEIVEKAIETFGRIDIVVNNIGGRPPKKRVPGGSPLGDVEAFWDDFYEGTLRAPVLMSEAVAPHMMQQKSGKIVFLGSIAGRFTPPVPMMESTVMPAYCAMKTAINSYTQAMALRLGPYNINVNCVCPGIVYTDAWKRHSRNAVENIPEFKGMEKEEWFKGIFLGSYPNRFPVTPLMREQTVEDIAEAIVFLVSDSATNVTGQILNVDGGMVMNR